jgi:hypothetical protein
MKARSPASNSFRNAFDMQAIMICDGGSLGLSLKFGLRVCRCPHYQHDDHCATLGALILRIDCSVLFSIDV